MKADTSPDQARCLVNIQSLAKKRKVYVFLSSVLISLRFFFQSTLICYFKGNTRVIRPIFRKDGFLCNSTIFKSNKNKKHHIKNSDFIHFCSSNMQNLCKASKIFQAYDTTYMWFPKNKTN